MSTVALSNSVVVISILSESEQSLLVHQKLETNAIAMCKEPDRHLPLNLKPMYGKETSHLTKDVFWEL
ncbi:unnamed protein product [Soboliphyme baturini]|uniref:Uncharacterized protein n=1 Tax=Soboliphyme baturini TaxID=241478 RepID=A0A183IAQ1_9BILA|nr:unnamed protein product [Soboliphyme baturini]